jgi:hypothetical protein
MDIISNTFKKTSGQQTQYKARTAVSISFLERKNINSKFFIKRKATTVVEKNKQG